MDLNSFEFGKILGYHISDGTLGEKSDFTNTNIDLVNDLARSMRIYYPENKVAIRLRKGGMYKDGMVRQPRYRLYCRMICKGGDHSVGNRWYHDYKALGLEGKQSIQSLMGGCRVFKIGLIQGIFNGDGSIMKYKRPSGKQEIRIKYNFGLSEKIAVDFVKILSEFNIKANYKRDNGTHGRDHHVVMVTNQESVSRNIDLLDDLKYPEKFDEAWAILRGSNPDHIKVGRWLEEHDPELVEEIMTEGSNALITVSR